MALETDVRGVIDETLRQLVVPGEVSLKLKSHDGINFRMEIEQFRSLDDRADGQPDDSADTGHQSHIHGTVENACPQSQ